MGFKQTPRIILRGDQEAANLLVRGGIRQLDILKNLMGFQNLKQDVRRVRFLDGSEIICRSVFGIDDIQIYVPKVEVKREAVSKLYIYVTISDYVTVWDLETGEVAKDIYSNEGWEIEFPCCKDELAGWLSGIKDKPTRQVLKDDPENNRDYLDDNHKDIGNENRLLSAMEADPSYCYYYGLSEPIDFLNHIEYSEDRCEPYYCILTACQPVPDCFIPNPDGCDILTINTFNTVEETDNESYAYYNIRSYLYDCYFFYRLFYCRKYRACRRSRNIISEPKYTQNYFDKSKHLYLCSYPGPCYYPVPLLDLCIPYCTSTHSSYEKPVDFEADHTYSYGTRDAILNPSLYINRFSKSVSTFTIKTVLGDLIIDNMPKREHNENLEKYYKAVRGAAMAGGCYDIAIPDNAYYATRDFEQATDVFGAHDISGDEPSHATGSLSWHRDEDRQAMTDTLPGENTRTGISWCGSLTPRDEFDGHGNIVKEAITKDWYRILLCFYMERQYVSGQAYFSGGAGLTEWEDYSAKRFSSVQATIELECPENYSKEKNVMRYKRSEDYSSLCAFPNRKCGYLEDKAVCYPFDGTYDIYTLGEAVEKLINNHYVDGSNDQLVVYLLNKQTMRKVP